jgi:hypothetical protein
MSRRENLKIRHKNSILKANEPAPDVRNLRSIKWHQKTYHIISWDYPFKVSLSNKYIEPPETTGIISLCLKIIALSFE